MHADALDAWLRILSGLCGFTFDELDSTLVSIGVAGSSAADDAWYEYELEGRGTISVRLAALPADGRVMVRVWCPEDLRLHAQFVTAIAQEYRLGLR